MNTEKVIQADIECLLNSIGRATAGGNAGRALEACGILKERLEDLDRVKMLKDVSKAHKQTQEEKHEQRDAGHDL